MSLTWERVGLELVGLLGPGEVVHGLVHGGVVADLRLHADAVALVLVLGAKRGRQTEEQAEKGQA